MKLSEFRVLIEKSHYNALIGTDYIESALAAIMLPAEYFAYHSIKTIKDDLQGRISDASNSMESLFHPENDGYLEAEGAHTALSDHMEFIDEFLTEGETSDSVLTPNTVDMVIDIN